MPGALGLMVVPVVAEDTDRKEDDRGVVVVVVAVPAVPVVVDELTLR